MSENDNDKLRAVRNVGMLTLIPMLLVAGPAVGYVCGSLLVRWTGAGSWLRILATCLGFAAGVREVVVLLKKVSQESERGGR